MALQLVIHEVRKEHAGTALGIAWAVIQPIMLVGAYFFLFTVLRVTKTAPHGQLGEVALITSGIVPWWYFMRSFTHGLGALDDHANLVKQINFPIGVIPFVSVGVNVLEFFIGLVMLLTLTIAEGWTGMNGLTLVLAALLMSAFLVGLSAMMAPLGVMLRDIRNLLPLVVRLGLWLSPVLYLPGRVPSRFEWVIYINPVAYFIGLIRYGALGRSFGGEKTAAVGPLVGFGISSGITVIVCLVGYWAWSRVRRGPVDYL